MPWKERSIVEERLRFVLRLKDAICPDLLRLAKNARGQTKTDPSGKSDSRSEVKVVQVLRGKMGDFERWLERPGGSPREVIERQRIRAILGMEVSRN
jgi:hypothetical protein